MCLPGYIHDAPPPAPAPPAQHLEGPQGFGLDGRLPVSRQAAGAEVTGVVPEILGFVVVEGVGRLDFDDGQHLFPQDAHGVFPPGHPLLRQHQLVVAGRFPVSPFQAAGQGNHGNPDGGAFAGGFDEQGQAQLFFHFSEIALLVQQGVVGHPQAGGLPEQLGAPFVHAQSGGQYPAARVRDVHQFQGALDGAVFPVAAVEGDKRPVIALQLVQGPFRRIKTMGIHPLAAQGGQDPGAAGEGDLAFAGLATEKHCHFAETACLTHCSNLSWGNRGRLQPAGLGFHGRRASSNPSAFKPCRRPTCRARGRWTRPPW